MNVIESYLVSLGFTGDEPSFRKFNSLLEQAEKSVESHASGMAKRIIEAQGTVVGAFTSISAAIVGLVDKVAMQDQAWRLLGLRYLMTTEQARKMDLITKTLGASLEEIVWDRELHGRAVVMAQDIDRWSQALGPDFEKKMLLLRDLRMEFGEVTIAARFFSMAFVGKLADKLGISDITVKMREFINNLSADKISQWADVLATEAVPVLKETWKILAGIGDVLKETGVAFTNFVGLLSNDQSIQGTSFSFMNMLKAIEHVEHGFENFLRWVQQAEEMLVHFASALALFVSGKFADAKTEFKAGMKELTTGSGALLGLAAGPVVGQVAGTVIGGILDGPPGALAGGFIGAHIGAPVGAAAGALAGSVHDGTLEALLKRAQASINAEPPAAPPAESASSFERWLRLSGSGIADYRDKLFDLFSPPKQTAEQPAIRQAISPQLPESSGIVDRMKNWILPKPEALSKSDVMRLIERAADQAGVPPALALSIAKQESGFQQFNKAGEVLSSKEGAMGVMQLMPSTARMLGVDPRDALQNISGGVKYLAELLRQFGGDDAKAAAAYNAGPSRIPINGALDLSKLPAETRGYVPKVLQYEKQFAEDDKSYFAPFAPNDALLSYLQRPPSAPQAGATSNEQNVDVGGINIYITQPGADAHAIQKAVSEGVRNGLASQIQLDLLQTSPAY